MDLPTPRIKLRQIGKVSFSIELAFLWIGGSVHPPAAQSHRRLTTCC